MIRKYIHNRHDSKATVDHVDLKLDLIYIIRKTTYNYMAT